MVHCIVTIVRKRDILLEIVKNLNVKYQVYNNSFTCPSSKQNLSTKTKPVTHVGLNIHIPCHELRIS